MKRHTTARSLYNDLMAGDRFACDDEIRAPLATIIKAKGSFKLDNGDTKWRMEKVMDILYEVAEVIERLLWDSGHLTEHEENTRQRLYVEFVKVKAQVEKTLTDNNGRRT